MSPTQSITQEASGWDDAGTLYALTILNGYDELISAQSANKVAALFAAKYNLDEIAEPVVDYSKEPEVLCHASGNEKKRKGLQSVPVVKEWASWSVLYVTKRLVAQRSYDHHNHLHLFFLVYE